MGPGVNVGVRNRNLCTEMHQHIGAVDGSVNGFDVAQLAENRLNFSSHLGGEPIESASVSPGVVAA